MIEKDNKKNLIISGVSWKLGERFLAQGVSFIVSVVLARILEPENYGLVSIVLIFINIANVFVTSGFSSALVQKKDADEVDFSTNFYCSLLISIVVYMLLFAIAPIISRFYNNESLTLILRIFSLKIPLSSISSIQHAYVERNMIFKVYFFSTLVGTIISGFVGILFAVNGFGVWALIAQYFTNSLIDIIMLFITTPWRPRKLFSISSAKSMMNFGSKILLADLSGTFFEQLRSLLVGKIYSASDLAYYDKGNHLPSLITTNITSSLITVLFPAISNINDNIEAVKELTRKSLNTIAYLVFPMLFGFAAIAKPFILTVYTEKWSASIPFVQVLSISYAFSLIGSVSLQALKAIGKSDVVLKIEFIKKPIYFILLFAGVKINVFAVALTMLIYSIYANCINAYYLSKYIGYKIREFFNDLAFPFFASALMSVSVYLLSFIKLRFEIILILQIVIGVIAYFCASVVMKAEPFLFLKSLLKGKLHKN